MSKLAAALEAWQAKYPPKPKSVFQAAPDAGKTPCTVPPQRLSQDQYRCVECGLVWDLDEARPPCIVLSTRKG